MFPKKKKKNLPLLESPNCCRRFPHRKSIYLRDEHSNYTTEHADYVGELFDSIEERFNYIGTLFNYPGRSSNSTQYTT